MMSLANGILGFLAYGSMSGYDLAKAFDASVGFFWYAQNSQIYLELDKLEKKGLVSCELIQQSDRPNKKLYTITEMGKRQLLNWLTDTSSDIPKGTKDGFLMKIFFSGWLSPEESIKRLKCFCKDCESYLEGMNTIPETIADYGDSTDEYTKLCWELTYDYGYANTKMRLDWAKRSIDKLEEYLK